MKIRLTSKHYDFTLETECSVSFPDVEEDVCVCYAQAEFNMATSIKPWTVALIIKFSVTENLFYCIFL